MRLELINTGTELLIGDVINTNAAWLGQRMVDLGVLVQRATIVPDGMAIEEALNEAVRRSDVVIITGGLGPTADDVSREAAAGVLGLALETDPEVMKVLEAIFARSGKLVNEHNQRQALVVKGAHVLANPHGTAPGLHLPRAWAHPKVCIAHCFFCPDRPGN